ncbi:Zinc finger protein [Armadillidium nasatum]|uniref:Zinc finger protein 593 homolog n=1 Tax=Armadillidium nasatum TaxID=96803 RepID=A0A5N5TJZ7_9CRUS|nr:Zinc finger protein [Armadillidium nasatum]
MGGPYKKKPKPRKVNQRLWKTKNRNKDLDEIDSDMKEENAPKLLKQEIDLDKPGSGQHYCLHCARYFITKEAMLSHFRTKGHKRRLKDLELEPYSQAEAERASGKGSYFEPKRRKVETQPIDENVINNLVGNALSSNNDAAT